MAEWIRHLAKEQIVTFVLSMLIGALFWGAGAIALLSSPPTATWAAGAWSTAIGGGLTALSLHVAVTIILASRKAVGEAEHGIKAKTDAIPETVRTAIAAARAEIKADTQSQLDLKVREERANANERANERIAEAVQAMQVELQRVQAVHSDTLRHLTATHEEVTALNGTLGAVINSLRQVGWKAEYSQQTKMLVNIAPPVEAGVSGPK